MSKKNRYRAAWLENVDIKQLSEEIEGRRLIIGIDVAKEDQYAAIMDASQRVHKTIKWKQPAQNQEFVTWVLQLSAEFESVEIAMEPSGTYGDAVRYQLVSANLPVFRVSPKRSHDAAEVYDGVPSLHDAKSAAIIAKLHLDGASDSWPIATDHERKLKARLRVFEIYSGQFQRNKNRLEALLARHFPEATQHLELGSVTLLELLILYGGPRTIADNIETARKQMHRVGGHFLKRDKVESFLMAAQTSCGMPMLEEEQLLICMIAKEARRNQTAASAAKKEVEQLAEAHEVTAQLGVVVGKTTAAVLVAAAGEPQNYGCADAYVKSLGLNLKEKSSGKEKGGLHITKRGSGLARFYLFFAVLRLIQRDPVVRAWYDKKVGRQGGRLRSKAIVAVMRKLVKALWHVARGNPFDARKLFDTRRLKLSTSQTLQPAESAQAGGVM